MKITNVAKVKVLGKTVTNGVKDTSKRYYGILVMQDADCGSLSCSEEVYNIVKEGETVNLITEYNQKYESFRVTGIQQK